MDEKLVDSNYSSVQEKNIFNGSKMSKTKCKMFSYTERKESVTVKMIPSHSITKVFTYTI